MRMNISMATHRFTSPTSLKRLAIAPTLGLVLSAATPAQTQAQTSSSYEEETIVTASRIDQKLSQVGSSVIVITQQEIEASQTTSVADLLEAETGISIDRTIVYKDTLRLRGMEAYQTLVLLDGIEITNPSDGDGSFDFSSLNINDIERIEVVKGPQSTIYGSRAAGGVINIITKKAKAGPPKFRLSGEYGSFNSRREVGSVSGGGQEASYLLQISDHNSTGYDQIPILDPGTDGENGQDVLAKLSLKPINDVTLNFTYLQNHGTEHYDYFGTGEYIDRDSKNFTSEGLWSSGVVNHKIQVSLQDDYYYLKSNDRDYNGNRQIIAYQGDGKINNNLTLTAGTQYEHDDYQTSADSFGDPERSGERNLKSLYSNLITSLADNQITVNIGGRSDDYSDFGLANTYRLTAAYLPSFFDGRVHSSYGTGFTPPSLDQLYGDYGNAKLQAEKSNGWDAGVEFELPRQMGNWDVTWFDNHYKDRITYDPNTSIPYNIDSASTSGLESTTKLSLRQYGFVKIGYTLTNSEVNATGRSLQLTPKHQADLSYTFLPLDKLKVTTTSNLASWRYRCDSTNSFCDKSDTVGGYVLFNLRADYRLNEATKLYGRVDNLLDHELVHLGYTADPGSKFFIGMSREF